MSFSAHLLSKLAPLSVGRLGCHSVLSLQDCANAGLQQPAQVEIVLATDFMPHLWPRIQIRTPLR